MPDFSWAQRAKCRGLDPALFDPINKAAIHAARLICAGCPVTVECLREAFILGDYELVRAGYTPVERKRLQRDHGVVVTPIRLGGRDRWGHLPSVEAEPT